MSDPIDTIIDDAESDTASLKGGRGGARNRYFFLAAIASDKKRIIFEAISADSVIDAKEIFSDKHGLAAMICDEGKGNGYYVAMGTGMSEAQRISVTVTPEQLMRRTKVAFKGQFRGWNVWASGLAACKVGDQEYNDNDLVSVVFDTLVDKNTKIPKPKLKQREAVRLSDLDEVELIPA